jgi:hypothetical protein
VNAVIPRVAGRLLRAPESVFRRFSTGDAGPGVEVPRRTGQQADSRAEQNAAKGGSQSRTSVGEVKSEGRDYHRRWRHSPSTN